MARAYVTGLQGDAEDEGISATLKHFVGHGATEGGKNRSSLDVGPRELREVHLFPYEAVIRTAGAESVMNAYHDIDGIPCASSEWLLTDVLRGEFGFDGTVVSDYFSVEFLHSEHGVAADEREAGVMAVEAGIDVELPYTDCYGEHLVEAVEAGELSAATLDEVAGRVLAMKFRKGVFDDPTVDADAASDAFNTDERTELTARAARESVTLLKNEADLLPLADADSIAVLGPKAEIPRNCSATTPTPHTTPRRRSPSRRPRRWTRSATAPATAPSSTCRGVRRPAPRPTSSTTRPRRPKTRT
jgi:beta-glucosidase